MSEIPKDGLCPECHAPNIRNVEATDGIYDVTSEEQVAHFKKRVTMCWDQKRLDNGTYTSHPFVEKLIPSVNLSTQEIHDELHCQTCGMFYARYNGRAASPQEIADCKAGKIPKASGKSRIIGG